MKSLRRAARRLPCLFVLPFAATLAFAAEPPRFTSFDNASPAVVDAVAKAAALAATVRNGNPSTSTLPVPLADAVAQASAAIVQEGRVVRSTVLADRQAALTRLRLAQTEAERQRIVQQLRDLSGQRLEEQREASRLVRDRLRELRVLTTLTPPGGG